MNKESTNSSCSVYYNLANLLHKSSKPHPESPQRLTTLIQCFQNLKKSLNFSIQEVKLGEGKITGKQTEEMLIKLHGESYWQFIKQMWHEGIKKSQMYINMDTYFMKDTYCAALQAARTTVTAADQLSSSAQKNLFAIVRPPGHHSGLKAQPHGFSFFNNIGLAANFLKQKKKAKRVAIVDWDVHHGEGTQKLFYNTKDVLFISLHRFDNGKFFPHIQQSSSKNIGTGEGTGFNINICWNLEQKPKGATYQRTETCGDEEYCYAFQKIVIPVLKQYQAQYILISCGFDSAHGDPIGNLALTGTGYAFMLRELMKLNKNILLVLEGGYNKQVLSWAGETIVRTLTNNMKAQTEGQIKKLKEREPNKIAVAGVEECLKSIQKYWSTL